MTCQVEIEHPRGFSCELGRLNEFLLKLGEDGRLGKGGHMANLEPTPEFELDSVCGCIGSLIRIMFFIKYRKKPRMIFII